jgi:hypothetical protein
MPTAEECTAYAEEYRRLALATDFLSTGPHAHRDIADLGNPSR